MKKLFTYLSFFFFSLTCFSQYEAVVYDYSLSYFNNGQPLPAEDKLLFSGPVDKSTELVEIALFKAKAKKSSYQAYWKRNPGETTDIYRIPFNYRLQANSEYDIRITQFTPMKQVEIASLKNNLKESLHFLAQEMISIEENQVGLKISASKLYTNFNHTVEDILSPYSFKNEWSFDGFSDITKMYLGQIEKTFDSSSNDTDKDKQLKKIQAYYDQKVKELQKLLDREIEPIFSQQILRSAKVDIVRDYPTEKITGSLALNVGYGGVFLDGEADDFSYDAAPYIGLSFPLSRRINTLPFLNNMSISLGAFVNNFENDLGEELTGPIFGRPYFLGLGYRLFRFIRLNAGAVVLEEEGTSNIDNGNVSISTNDISIRPFVGISAEINFSIGLGRK